ncbi:MAG TPA: hypothetical protein VJ553_05915 [Candidatus Paceibacterota bacterium]|nr:hypothetical protein [Candidatus Paceibacterota bacterium]
MAGGSDYEIPDDIQGPDRLAILRLDPILRPAAVKITRNVRERERLRRPMDLDAPPPNYQDVDNDAIDGRYT